MHTFASGTIRESFRTSVPVTDALFDRIFPPAIQSKSRSHWTPVEAALRAVALLAPRPGMRVLDAGAGPGKLCCIGALASNASWYGIERDPMLVEVARSSAELLGIADRARFCRADMCELDWTEFQSIYLFNPFEEALYEGTSRVEGAWERFDREVSTVEERLARMPRGTRVVTFHGFGGDMPPGYVRAVVEHVADGDLELWINDRPEAAEGRA